MTQLASLTGAVVPGGFWPLLAAVLTRGTVLFLLAYGAGRVLPGLRPGHRHALWFVVTFGFLALPAARWVVPAIPFTALTHASVYGILVAPLAYRGTVEAAIAGAAPAVAAQTGGVWSALRWSVGIVYLGGVLFCAFRPLVAWVAFRGLRADVHSRAHLSRIGKPLVCRPRRRPVILGVHPRVAAPFTFGILRPWVVLPTASLAWPQSRLRAVLAHELAHIRRNDALVDVFAYAICSVLWFLPPVWISRSLMRRAAELCCDCSVLDQGFSRAEYARTLLELAARHGGAPLLAAHGLLGRSNAVEERIRAILGPSRGPLRRGGVPALALCMLVALLIPGLTLVQRDGLFGSWMNSGHQGPALYTWSDDGIGRRYARVYASLGSGAGQGRGTLLIDLGPFVIEKRWIGSAGESWYEVKTWWSLQGAPRYALIRMDASGNSYESDESLGGYPTGLGGQVGIGMHQRYERR